MQEELKLQKINDEIELKNFKQPTYDINDEEIARRQLEEFIALGNANKED